MVTRLTIYEILDEKQLFWSFSDGCLGSLFIIYTVFRILFLVQNNEPFHVNVSVVGSRQAPFTALLRKHYHQPSILCLFLSWTIFNNDGAILLAVKFLSGRALLSDSDSSKHVVMIVCLHRKGRLQGDRGGENPEYDRRALRR